MSNLLVKDGASASKYIKGSGAGSDGDPFIAEHLVALSPTDNAVLDTIDAAIDEINAKLVTGTVIGDVNLGATDNAVLDAAVATLGATSGAAVITDANGTIQQYLRGLVTLDLVDNAVLDNIAAIGTGWSYAQTLTVTNDVYTAGDAVGGLITITNAARANAGLSMIDSFSLCGVDDLAYEIYFLNADIATPAADNAAFTIVAADEAKVYGAYPIAAAGYLSPTASFMIFTEDNLGLVIKTGAATTSFYAYIKTTVTTTPGTTTLYFKVSGHYLT